MCGFIVSHVGETVEERFVSRRGPDYHGQYTCMGLLFQHYLLHVTGECLPQPLLNGPIVCIFNGELYPNNYEISDGEHIIPTYLRYGEEFARHLDGEYSIALYDFGRERIVFATDPFGTKPLWTRGVCCASYPSAVCGGVRVPPNTTIVRDLAGRTRHVSTNHTFDFSNQNKSSFDDWIKAFRASIKKRANSGCYMGLSSGHDSGAIACELARQSCDFAAFSFLGNEHLPTLRSRHTLVGGRCIKGDWGTYCSEREFLSKHCEPYDYHGATGKRTSDNMHDDPGAVGLSLIHRIAKSEGRKVFISGQGADEILADYSRSSTISHFHGVFPTNLYAWPNFAGGCQAAYLTKEEFVGGAHGIEARFPFLDKSVVQEFLWLAPKLKNQRYKAPLYEYLRSENFPIWEGSKIGFDVFHTSSPFFGRNSSTT